MAGERHHDGRSETATEKLDRNWNDLLQELRVAQTGVQLLTGLLLTLPHPSAGSPVLPPRWRPRRRRRYPACRARHTPRQSSWVTFHARDRQACGRSATARTQSPTPRRGLETRTNGGM